MFQSTPSARRATHARHAVAVVLLVSIHALRTEGDFRSSRGSTGTVRFNPRPPHGGAPLWLHVSAHPNEFQSTPSARGRPITTGRPSAPHEISIHALRTEGGVDQPSIHNVATLFQSTPSARRATDCCSKSSTSCRVSIHALRTEGDESLIASGEILDVSIHALRTEGDNRHVCHHGTITRFNPRPPHGGRRRRWRRCLPRTSFNPRPPHGGRHDADRVLDSDARFQSTPSARRATAFWDMTGTRQYGFQSTPSARRATGLRCARRRRFSSFNPRPPHGGRQYCSARCRKRSEFQSTPSARRATVDALDLHHIRRVSIHALRTEGDVRYRVRELRRRCFNPRPPHGGRPLGWSEQCKDGTFQSTPSARRATARKAFYQFTSFEFQSTPSARRATLAAPMAITQMPVSIHALRTEGDLDDGVDLHPNAFQSTPSARRATRRYPQFVPAWVVSIHALRTEGDSRAASKWWISHVSIHALRTEGDQEDTREGGAAHCFNPRPPHGGRHTDRGTVLATELFQSRPPHGGRPR